MTHGSFSPTPGFCPPFRKFQGQVILNPFHFALVVAQTTAKVVYVNGGLQWPPSLKKGYKHGFNIFITSWFPGVNFIYVGVLNIDATMLNFWQMKYNPLFFWRSEPLDVPVSGILPHLAGRCFSHSVSLWVPNMQWCKLIATTNQHLHGFQWVRTCQNYPIRVLLWVIHDQSKAWFPHRSVCRPAMFAFNNSPLYVHQILIGKRPSFYLYMHLIHLRRIPYIYVYIYIHVI